MRKLALAALLAFLAFAGAPSFAADQPVTAGGYTDFGCSSGPGIGCAGLQRPANTTAYASGEIVCAATCAPLQIVAGRNAANSAGTGLGFNVTLLKSGVGTTNATFNVFFYGAPPTFPAALADQAAYVGPYAADIISGNFIGSASCSTTNNTTDSPAQVYYTCSINSGGPQVLGLKTTLSTTLNNTRILYAVIEAAGSYTPASGEKFYVTTYEIQD